MCVCAHLQLATRLLEVGRSLCAGSAAKRWGVRSVAERDCMAPVAGVQGERSVSKSSVWLSRDFDRSSLKRRGGAAANAPASS